MKTSDTTAKGTLGVPTPLNRDGGVLESSSGGVLPSQQQDITQTEVSRIISDIGQALSPEETTQAKEQALEFQEKMELFVQEVERVREGFRYRYDGEDYKKRLSVSDEVFRSVFERILTENEGLRILYDRIIRGFSGDKDKLKEKILKEHGQDLVYEGMKRWEYSGVTKVKLDFTGKSAKEVKEMVVWFARSGGKVLDLRSNWLGEIFTGEPRLFKEMVVEFARSGGKWLDLRENGLGEVVTGKPRLFKDMVVEYVEFGGKGLNLAWNDLTQILDSTIEIKGAAPNRTIREIIEETRRTYRVTICLVQ